MSSDSKVNKRIIGQYGEMNFIMKAHQNGWQIYRPVIDENTDFVISRFWCKKCDKFSELEMRPIMNKKGDSTGGNFPSDCCKFCKEPELVNIVRFIQVKTSEGIGDDEIRKYSFHAKLRSNADPRSYYAWIAVLPKGRAHFYIFHHSEVNRFDDLALDSYQKTDNQKTTLRINSKGEVVNEGRKYDFSCFNKDFHNNFDGLKERIDEDFFIKRT